MSANTSSQAELGNIEYEIFIGALTVLSLVNIVLILLLRDQALQNRRLYAQHPVQHCFCHRLPRQTPSGTLANRLRLPPVWLGRSARKPPVSASETPETLPAYPGGPTAPPIRSSKHWQKPRQGQGRQRSLVPPVHRRHGA
jgi:hypothetical protein